MNSETNWQSMKKKTKAHLVRFQGEEVNKTIENTMSLTGCRQKPPDQSPPLLFVQIICSFNEIEYLKQVCTCTLFI